MRPSNLHRALATALALLLIAAPGQARRLMETGGIELRGAARVLTYGAATCHVLEEKHSDEDYARLKVNEGKPLNLWQLDFSVYNGSGKALDHLIARYNIETQWPPCTNWSFKPGVDASEASWSSDSGHIQRTGEPYSVAPGETLTKELFFIVFHEDEPRFDRWSVDYNVAAGTPAAPVAQAPQAQAAPPAAQPAQAPGRPAGISAGDTCAGKAEGSACWLALDNPPGCYLWNGYLSVNETATWSGACTGGLAEGAGEIFMVWDSDRKGSVTATGQLQQGKMHGRWVSRHANGDMEEGPYVDGKRHGRWVTRHANGGVQEGPYVDGKEHGRWVLRDADGTVSEGPFVDGKWHGRWVWRYADGRVSEGPIVDDELHGRWVLRDADGKVLGEANFVNGVEQ